MKNVEIINKFFYLAHLNPLSNIYNWFRAKYHNRRYGIDDPYMFHAVELEINSICNRRCSCCPNSIYQRPIGYMDTDLFYKIIQQLAAINFDGRVSYHFYGEPLLDKRLIEFIEYTKIHIPYCKPIVYSNGDLLDLNIFRLLIQKGMNKIVIIEQDDIYPKNILHLLENITENEKQHLELDLMKNLFYSNRAGLLKHLKKVSEPLSVPCDRPLAIINILLNGNIVLCCNDYFENNVLGNVNKDNLKDIWTSAYFKEVRYILSSGDRKKLDICSRCDYIPSELQLLRIIPVI